jgi:hypothetical protein
LGVWSVDRQLGLLPVAGLVAVAAAELLGCFAAAAAAVLRLRALLEPWATLSSTSARRPCVDTNVHELEHCHT